MAYAGVTIDRTYEKSYFAERGVSKEIFDQFFLGSVIHAPAPLAYKIPAGTPAFPIYDINSEYAGWGFRPNHSDFKYYYADVSVASHLYGLNAALPHILREGKVIVVEGFFDVLMAHTAGLKNVVGAFSNTLSKNQIILLGSITSNVVLSFDSDNAGITGDNRAEENTKKILPDMNISRFLLYPHHDFCDYAKARIEYEEASSN